MSVHVLSTCVPPIGYKLRFRIADNLYIVSDEHYAMIMHGGEVYNLSESVSWSAASSYVRDAHDNRWSVLLEGRGYIRLQNGGFSCICSEVIIQTTDEFHEKLAVYDEHRAGNITTATVVNEKIAAKLRIKWRADN